MKFRRCGSGNPDPNVSVRFNSHPFRAICSEKHEAGRGSVINIGVVGIICERAAGHHQTQRIRRRVVSQSKLIRNRRSGDGVPESQGYFRAGQGASHAQSLGGICPGKIGATSKNAAVIILNPSIRPKDSSSGGGTRIPIRS